MSTFEANIKITRKGKKLKSVSVFMPIWNKVSDHGNLLVKLPLLGIETIANDEKDAEKAIEEAIGAFCQIAEKFGQGLENELMALGGVVVEEESGGAALGYNVADPDSLVDRLIQTGDNYINEKLEIAA